MKIRFAPLYDEGLTPLILLLWLRYLALAAPDFILFGPCYVIERWRWRATGATEMSVTVRSRAAPPALFYNRCVFLRALRRDLASVTLPANIRRHDEEPEAA